MEICYRNWLENQGINIHDPDYKQSEEYLKIKHELILGPNGFITMEQYIERNLLEPNEVLDTYESIYDMGNPYELEEDECQYTALAKDIIFHSDLGMDIKVSDLEAEAIEFVGKLNRVGGLIDRLRTQLNFDVKWFDPENIKHRAEICKIIYFVYMLENKEISKMLGTGKTYFNVLKFLRKPSMESIDNTPLGGKTYNGEITGFIKHALEKEITAATANSIKKDVHKITSDWEQVIQNAYLLFNFLLDNDYVYDIEPVIHTLDKDFLFDDDDVYDINPVIHALNTESEEVSSLRNIVVFTLSPISLFYLKILQHELIGNVKDIALTNRVPMQIDNHIPQELVKEMILLSKSIIDINDTDHYIDVNAAKIARYVYLDSIKDKSEAVRRIKGCKEKVKRWLDFCVRARPLLDRQEIANELQIISILQVILLDDQSETFNYKPYGYQHHMKHRPQVQGALKNNKRTVDALQIYWVSKVTDRWYTNVGRSFVRANVRELEYFCDNIIINILTRPNLDEMVERHQYYMERVSDELITTAAQIQASKQFADDLHRRGFRYVDEGYKIRNAFLYPAEIPQTLVALATLLDSTIKEMDSQLDVALETSTANGKRQITLDFVFLFDYRNKICTCQNMNIRH